MSNINYAVYGTPDLWQYWVGATPTGGANGTTYGQQRVGATDWTNADFTDYPAFMFGRENLYRTYKLNGYIDINTPFDNSISYTAIANPELPQNNIAVLDSTHTTLANPLATTDNTTPTPFAVGWYYKGSAIVSNPSYAGSLYGFDGFPNDATVFGSQGMQRLSPYALWDSTFSYDWGKYNPNLRIIPCVMFGTKSIILEINVLYIDGSSYLHSNLKSYLNHTTEWLQSHKIIGAHCIPYFRVNTNGTYLPNALGVTLTPQLTGICPLFFRPYKLDGLDIYNYTAYFQSSGGGNFPIFGAPISDSSYTSNYIRSEPVTTPTQTSMGSYACLYGVNKGTLNTYHSGNTQYFRLELDLSITENVEFIMKGAAAYGLFFCQAIGTLGNSGRDTGATERWLDTEMYCGVIESDGMTYGSYTQGEGNKDNQVYDWKDSTQTPFDPSNIPDTDNTHYDDETHFNHYGLTACSCNQYVVYESDLVQLCDIIATAINTRPDPDQLSTVDYALNNGLTNNPVDTIISVRAYPARSIPITQKLVGGVLTDHEPLHCGAWFNTDVTGYFLGRTYDTIDFSFRRGTNNGFVSAFGKSFLDFSPYTRAELIIPYCGTVTLSSADFIDHDINVKIIVDYITGICTAFVMRENVAVMSVSGSMGIDVPITGLQNATYDSQRLNAVINRENANSSMTGSAVGLFASSVGLAASVASGNVVGAIASIGGLGASIARQPSVQNQLGKAEYELTHQQVPVKVVQSGSPMISYVYENACRLIVYRPVISDDYDPAVYAQTVGFACLINGKVSDFTGLTVGTIDTAGINCTEKEKEMIQKAFATGVYL